MELPRPENDCIADTLPTAPQLGPDSVAEQLELNLDLPLGQRLRLNAAAIMRALDNKEPIAEIMATPKYGGPEAALLAARALRAQQRRRKQNGL